MLHKNPLRGCGKHRGFEVDSPEILAPDVTTLLTPTLPNRNFRVA
jgi:hypothetical protein